MEMFYDIGPGKDWLDKNIEVQSPKENWTILAYRKQKNFLYSKGNNPQKWETTCGMKEKFFQLFIWKWVSI
jgi:hypothetical protein